MKRTQSTAILEFLSELELREETLLAWGLTDTEILPDELRRYAGEFANASRGVVTPDELIDTLVERRLLFRFRRYEREFYRTRMSETVRLLASLRQWLRNRDWRTAPTLVADYRLSLRKRVYPRREIPSGSFVSRLQEDIQLAGQQRDAIAVLTADKQFAEFQYQATRQVLTDVRLRQTRGVIIGAGTGTGKTLAFYLPALATLVPLIEPGFHWTKLIAIYPRNELLKDQMSEVFGLARSLDAITRSQRGRGIRLGCFYGDTPKSASDVDGKWAKDSTGMGYVCPFLRCPTCGKQAVWPFDEVRANKEALRCSDRNCGFSASGEDIALTREAMQRAAPDILFTSTEMLNRMISDSRFCPIFGVGAKAPPRMVLLDEVHTYSGTSGAQAVLLLRRWLHATGAQPHFTGLSATLRDAGEYFSQLTGIPVARITEIVPGLDGPADEMEEEGMEYRIALRSDPVSETATLSTTVQAAMLIRRALDPPDTSPSEGAYGRRVFAFCDDLDIVNRLYNILLDAEGWQRNAAPRIPLAALRSAVSGTDENARFVAGQSWRLCEDIGHQLGLTRNLQITRTSSQDPGVDADADIVVATASLEVGFNDPEVGVVLQHKAPHDMASFLQRRGRAGRPRSMRPWTLVVLSDYGRDRTAYQAYDALFDPELEPRYLPVSNRYILRMQAVFALMDWVADCISKDSQIKRGDVWRDFAGPATGAYADYRRPRQLAEQKLIQSLLDNDSQRTASLEEWLEKGLQISRDEVVALLWEPPRALMTEVLPTLYRRLDTNWAKVSVRSDESKWDYVWDGNPLPDFIPPNLFTDLNLPEVRIIVRQSPNGRETEHAEPIQRSMQILAPGRVTRRFATERGFISHWIAPRDLAGARQTMAIGEICTEFQDLGEFSSFEDGQVVARRCVRPIEMRPQIVPQRISSTSNSTLDWRSQLSAVGAGRQVEVNSEWGWSSLVPEITFFLHNHHSHALVRRFATGADAELKSKGVTTRIRIDFCEPDRRPAAIGYSQTVDAVRFRVRVPEHFGLRMDDPNRDKIRAFRTAYYRHRIHESKLLGDDLNRFSRDRLCDVYLSALLTYSLLNNCSLAESNHFLLSAPAGRTETAAVLEVIFRTLDAELDENADDDGESREQRLGRMHERLLGCLADDRVFSGLAAEAKVLWEDPDESSQRWARERLLSTIGRALLDACNRLCPQFDGKDLLLDLDSGPPIAESQALPHGEYDVWISEATMGGAGAIEELFRQYTSSPRRFFQLALAALEPSDFEEVDVSLRSFVKALTRDAEAKDIIQDTRQAEGLEEKARVAARLRDALLQRGYTPHHSLLTALQSRLLRPGSSPATDELIRRLIVLLEQQEELLGVEMDMRVFAYVASRDQTVREAFEAIPEFAGGDENWRCSTIYGLLWPHGNAIRSRNLFYYHPFAEQPLPERSLLQDLLLQVEAAVRVTDTNWKTTLATFLTQKGSCRIRAPLGERARLSEALLDLAVDPVEMDALLLYPSVGRIRQDGEWLEATVQLKEAF